MKFVLITKDADLEAEARSGLHPSDQLEVFQDWRHALEACEGVDLLFVDQLATLEEPHKIAGYEVFAEAKMSHQIASGTKLALVSPPVEYDIDFVVGWEGFVYLHYRRPIDYKIFRRASTWV